MGCDIHLFVEKRNKATGKWEAVNAINEIEVAETKDLIRKIEGRGESADYWKRRLKELQAGTPDYIWYGRHYLFFEVLAGVRAKHDLEPVSQPKGLPDDISPEAREAAAFWDVDGHSHSWLTAAELNAYNWDQVITREGWVNFQEFKEFMENGEPPGWCGGVGGGGVRHVSNREMKEGIRDGFIGDPRDYYTLIHWDKPLRPALGTWCSWSLPKLNELAGDDPESARILFWFDN
ncbi:hypothetical protein [Paenibacillus chitinolyticus]